MARIGRPYPDWFHSILAIKGPEEISKKNLAELLEISRNNLGERLQKHNISGTQKIPDGGFRAEVFYNLSDLKSKINKVIIEWENET